jgi:hypothetical protein
MAITVTLDIYPNTSLETQIAATGSPNRFARYALVDGIDVTVVAGSPKYEAMFLAQQAVVDAAAASPLDNHPEYVLQSILLDPISDTQAIARLLYETVVFGQGIPPSTYVLTDGGQLTTVATNFIINADGKRRKLALSWDPPKLTGAKRISEDLVTHGFLFPDRVLQVDALIYGRPTNGQGYLRHVNNATWPTQAPTWPGQPVSGPTPLGRAYWLLSEYVTRMSRIGGYYTLSARAISRVVADWSEMIILQDTHTGKFVQVGSTPAKGDAIIDALFEQPYVNDVVQGVDPEKGGRFTGVARVGAYPLADFHAIFGF